MSNGNPVLDFMDPQALPSPTGADSLAKRKDWQQNKINTKANDQIKIPRRHFLPHEGKNSCLIPSFSTLGSY